jgi:seryl-tRNA synthetase
MALSPDNFKDVDFVLSYVGSSNRNELNDKLRDDNVTVDSLQIIVMLCSELRKLKNASSNAQAAINDAEASVKAAEADREAKAANEEKANEIRSGGAFGAKSSPAPTSTDAKIEADSKSA